MTDWRSEYVTISLPGHAWLTLWAGVRVLQRVHAFRGEHERADLRAVEGIIADRLDLKPDGAPPDVACTTDDCDAVASSMVKLFEPEEEGPWPYCRACTDILTRMGGGADCGPLGARR